MHNDVGQWKGKFVEAKKRSNQDIKLEADARNALLAHYSSKSTNETAVLIGLAVVIFADFQAYSALDFLQIWQKITFLTLSLGIIAFLIIRQLSRLIIWGKLADAVLCVKVASAGETETWLGKGKVKPVRIGLDSTTYLEQLVVGCHLRFYDCYDQNKTPPSSFWDSVPLRIYGITNNKCFIETYIVAILGVLAISLMVAYVFFSLF